ncbi:hypothetical protein D3C75_618340 [compost metagenome]
MKKKKRLKPKLPRLLVTLAQNLPLQKYQASQVKVVKPPTQSLKCQLKALQAKMLQVMAVTLLLQLNQWRALNPLPVNHLSMASLLWKVLKAPSLSLLKALMHCLLKLVNLHCQKAPTVLNHRSLNSKVAMPLSTQLLIRARS